ncbi:MAG TPA: hypothetical protein VFU45_00045 [Gemmatimonadales bacterium]|nr:hypothetical protein [Gemmatimonadales bacterium]
MIRSRRGIALVELAVALAALLVLAGLIAPMIRARRVRVRAIRIVAEVKKGVVALGNYDREHNQWPASAGTGLTPAGLGSGPTGPTFRADDYVLRYTLRPSTTPDGPVEHPIIVVRPTDPRACSDVYDGLGGEENPNAFAYCSTESGAVYLFLN